MPRTGLSITGEALLDRMMKYALIFGAYFLMSVFLVNKGLDLTDTGYHLANQMNVRKHGLDYIAIVPFYWLSDVLAAKTGGLFGGWTLLEMRGVVLAMGCGQIVILLRMIGHFGLILTWPLTILVTLLGLSMTAPYGCVMLVADYYVVPSFFAYISFLLLAGFFARPSGVKGMALGVFCFLLLNLRLPAGIIIACLPLLAIAVQADFKRDVTPVKKGLFFLYVVCFVLVGMEYLYFSQRPGVVAAIGSGEWREDDTHGLAMILSAYAEEFLLAIADAVFLQTGLVLFLVIWISDFILRHEKISLLPRTAKEKIGAITCSKPGILAACLGIGWAYEIILHAKILSIDIIDFPQLIALSYLFYAGAVLYLLFFDRAFLDRFAAVILGGGIIPLAVFMGTNTGLTKIAYAFPLLVIVLYFIAANLPVQAKKPITFFLLFFYITSFGFILVKADNHFYENVQISYARNLTYEMQRGKVKGTLTRPNSGKAFDELLAQIEQRTQKDDKIFAYLLLPMVYFAADRGNVIDDLPNYDIFQPPQLLKKKLARLCGDAATTPKIIVRSRKNVWDKNWEINIAAARTEPKSNSWHARDNAAEIERVVKTNCRPELVWQNDYFQIFRPGVSAGEGRH